MSATLDLACDLIARPSVTPEDAGCQTLIARRLAALGFRTEPMRFGEVDNLWARLGSEPPVVCLAGHTDVVPTGPTSDWSSPPFEPTIRDGWLYGRGAADMKSALAAMVTACERYLATRSSASGSLAFLVTSDEEGIAVDGTRAVVERLERRGEKIDYCLIGEPSSTNRLGDTIRIGRRGSLSAELTVRGIQGHVAYAEVARNPLHDLFPVFSELCQTRWDEGNTVFPPTGFQATNLRAGTGAMNVIPGDAQVRFNFRYSTEQTMERLQTRVQHVLDAHGLAYDILWRDVGRPFLTTDGPLTRAVQTGVREVLGIDPELSTGGGTSDGRFIAPTGADVIELGLLNESIHQVDERTPVNDIDALGETYQRVLAELLGV